MSSHGEAAASGQNESLLVERVRRGDAAAFATLVDLYADQAFSVAYGFLRHVQDAEDLVQDSFIRALERIDSLKRGSAFGPWFYRLLVNAANNRRRYLALRRMRVIPAEARGPEDPATEAEVSELRGRLERALEVLPEDLKAVVLLHDLEGFTHSEIGEILGVPEGTSRSHLFRARRLLREELQDYRHRVR